MDRIFILDPKKLEERKIINYKSIYANEKRNFPLNQFCLGNCIELRSISHLMEKAIII